jgi:hypothetical protein
MASLACPAGAGFEQCINDLYAAEVARVDELERKFRHALGHLYRLG